MSAEPKSPTKEEMPRLPGDVQKEMFGVQLRHGGDTQEKNVLPSALDVTQEKQEQRHQDVVSEVEQFSRKSLVHTDPVEKNPLPTKDDVVAEKICNAKERVSEEACRFDHASLKPAKTVEKHVVEVISDEKSP